MTSADPPAQRHSRADEAELIRDAVLKAEAEARNGLRQFDAGRAIIQTALESGSFKLRLSHLLGLQREALIGISSYAGNFRPAGVEIQGSTHAPPSAHLVPALVEEMCDYVNDNWVEKTAIHLASYVMWRLNWIHPFADGNGRTSRTTSYVILCIKLGADLPGVPTIPDQIVKNRQPYFDALDEADAAWREGRIDVSKMEELLSGMLAKQLHGAYEQAGGLPPSEVESD